MLFRRRKFSWCFILVKALAQVSLACVPFAFKTIAKCSGDADAIIQRVVCFLRWVQLYSVDPWYVVVEIIDTRPKIWCVLPVIDDDIYSLFRESSVTIHQYCCMGKSSLSLHNISCPGVTMKDSDYQNGNPMCEEQHNQFLYLCNTNNPNQRNLSLCYLVIFFGFIYIICI